MTRFNTKRGRVAGLLLWLSVSGGLGACEDDGTSRESARDMATTATCNYWQRCDGIGPGKMYETRDSCTVQMRASFDGIWPPAACDGKILEEPLRVCLQQINVAQCGSGLDFLSALDKCQRARICASPPPSG